MAGPMLAAKLQHVERADEVRADVSARIFQAVAHARLGREMDHRIEPVRRKNPGQRIDVLEHDLMQLALVAASQLRVPRLF